MKQSGNKFRYSSCEKSLVTGVQFGLMSEQEIVSWMQQTRARLSASPLSLHLSCSCSLPSNCWDCLYEGHHLFLRASAFCGSSQDWERPRLGWAGIWAPRPQSQAVRPLFSHKTSAKNAIIVDGETIWPQPNSILLLLCFSNCDIKREWTVDELKKANQADINQPQGLCDPRLGISGPREKCKTCLESLECPGHFGRIELAKPIYHIGYINQVVKILKCICYNCGRLKVPVI